jgi:hypothetical protein
MSNYLNESAQTRRNVISQTFPLQKAAKSALVHIFLSAVECMMGWEWTKNPFMQNRYATGAGRDKTIALNIAKETTFFRSYMLYICPER